MDWVIQASGQWSFLCCASVEQIHTGLTWIPSCDNVMVSSNSPECHIHLKKSKYLAYLKTLSHQQSIQNLEISSEQESIAQGTLYELLRLSLQSLYCWIVLKRGCTGDGTLKYRLQWPCKHYWHTCTSTCRKCRMGVWFLSCLVCAFAVLFV